MPGVAAGTTRKRRPVHVAARDAVVLTRIRLCHGDTSMASGANRTWRSCEVAMPRRVSTKRQPHTHPSAATVCATTHTKKGIKRALMGLCELLDGIFRHEVAKLGRGGAGCGHIPEGAVLCHGQLRLLSDCCLSPDARKPTNRHTKYNTSTTYQVHNATRSSCQHQIQHQRCTVVNCETS